MLEFGLSSNDAWYSTCGPDLDELKGLDCLATQLVSKKKKNSRSANHGKWFANRFVVVIGGRLHAG